jgi:ribonuclease HI
MSRYLNDTPTWKSHPNPTEHYIPNLTPYGPRYTSHHSINSIYIFADGSAAGPCPLTRRSTVAGYGVCYGPTRSERLYGQLESGPFDSSRAELRGLLAALEARSWSSEGSTWVGVLGDAQSIYSTAGIIESLELNGYRRSAQSRSKWRKRNFKAGIVGGEELMSDLDLWKKVSARIRMLEERGTRVMFGWIPRKFNKEADRLACQGRVRIRLSAQFRTAPLIVGHTEFEQDCIAKAAPTTT